MRIGVVLVLTLLTGCPFSGDDGDGDNYVVVGDIPTAYKEANCRYLARCGVFPDEATCMAARLNNAAYIDPDLLAAIGAGRVIYNGSNVSACFDAIANATCDQTDQDGRLHLPACDAFFQGTLLGGESCLIDEECISGECSGVASGEECTTGVCIGDTAPVADKSGLGQPCSGLEDCLDGLYCDFDLQQCATLKPMDTLCTQPTECAYGLGCAGSTGARTCTPLPTAGQPCPDFVCRDDGLFCNASGFCEQIGVAGATCTDVYQCSTYYPCDFTTNTCKQGPALGESCTPSTNNCFAADTFCDSATYTCAPLKSDGIPCITDAECTSGNCDFESSVCMTPEACF
jgi:hypothetical protein